METVLQYHESFATGVAAIIALCVGILGFRVNQSRMKAQNTLGLTLQMITDPDLVAGLKVIEDAFLKKQMISANSVDEDTLYSISISLSILEYLAFAYIQGTVDKKTIDTLVRHRMYKSFLVCRPIIDERRRTYDGYFRRLEAMACSGPEKKFFFDQFKNVR